ncbi:CD3324 family protein [Neobacillus mesonae]|nr:CD3324 family protein [Neobacillus mesonae]
MMYKNGRDALPPSLLKEIQKYIQGDLIYIPKATEERARWGEKSGARKQLAQRNAEISLYYSKGWSVSELEQKYHLSSESIRKIVVKTR